jgi:hypothetical protein
MPKYILILMIFALTPKLSAIQQHGIGESGSSPKSTLDPDELAVMAVVLDAVYPKEAKGWVLLSARTATFECNPPANTGLNIGGCSGMRTPNQSPEEYLSLVRKAIPSVSDELADDLISKSQRSAVLSRIFDVPIRQCLYAPGEAFDSGFSGNPEFAAYFSRVAFDAQHYKAFLYLGMVNWSDQSKSMGQYLYLEKNSASWAIKSHAKIWDFGKGAF